MLTNPKITKPFLGYFAEESFVPSPWGKKNYQQICYGYFLSGGEIFQFSSSLGRRYPTSVNDLLYRERANRRLALFVPDKAACM